MDKRITCSDCPLNGVGTDELCEDYCSDMADFIDEIRADAITDCILENGEYCWQECCETEHCKECKWLGNGDTIWFEQMQKGAE